MAFVTPYEFTALELVTAALMNGIQDNISEIWKGQAAGDLDYYTSSTAKSRLAIGTAYQYLITNSGATAPVWVTRPQFCQITADGTQTITTGETAVLLPTETFDTHAWHNPSSNTNRITPGIAGYYRAFGYLQIDDIGGASYYLYTQGIRKNGTGLYYNREDSEQTANDKLMSISTPLISMNGTTDYIDMSVEQTTGDTLTISSASTLCVEFVRPLS